MSNDINFVRATPLFGRLHPFNYTKKLKIYCIVGIPGRIRS